ncbi:efflux RND transporter periplasmic adaptor subunit [Clostridiaceae bacterium 35-E11]
MKSKRFIYFVLILCGQVVFAGCDLHKTTEVATEVLKPAVIQEVKEQTYADEISLSGNIKPSKTVKLSYKIAGVIENVFVEEGQAVGKNDMVMMLDDYDYVLNAKAAKATWTASKMKMDSQIPSKMNQAKAKLDVVEKNYGRIKELYEEGAVSEAQMEQVEAEYIAASNMYQEAMDAKEYTRIELEKAEALRDVADANLKDTKLLSPIDGVVLKKLAESGETVAPGYPVVILGEVGEVETEVGVADAYINKIKKGQEAEVYVYGVEKEFKGIIGEVGAMADPETRTFPVKIQINNEENLLKPGMVAKVSIPLAEQKSVFVPVDSVMNMPEGPIVFVYDEKKGEVQKRKVVPGNLLKDEIEIKEGLKVGEKIVVEGQFKLSDHDKINVEEAK